MESTISSIYLGYYKKHCSGLKAPCWIPQADTLPGLEVLMPCTSWKEYHCMLKSVRVGRFRAGHGCRKSCTEDRFEIATRQTTLLPTVKVRTCS